MKLQAFKTKGVPSPIAIGGADGALLALMCCASAAKGAGSPGGRQSL